MNKVYLLWTSFDQKERPGGTPTVFSIHHSGEAALQRLQEMEEEKRLGQLPPFWNMHVEGREVLP